MAGRTKRAATVGLPGLSEHAMQVAVVDWARLQACVLWPLELLYAVPNGGKRPPKIGRKMKDEGQRKGVLDLVLPVPAAGWIGLYVEMKTATGVVSADQKWWADRLRAVGYRVVVCRSIEDGCAVLREHAMAARAERPHGFGPFSAESLEYQKAKPPTGGKGASVSSPEKAISTRGNEMIGPQNTTLASRGQA